jgi:hypothetical protein
VKSFSYHCTGEQNWCLYSHQLLASVDSFAKFGTHASNSIMSKDVSSSSALVYMFAVLMFIVISARASYWIRHAETGDIDAEALISKISRDQSSGHRLPTLNKRTD